MIGPTDLFLHIEDDALWRQIVAKLIHEEYPDVSIHQAATLSEARHKLRQHRFSIVILDTQLADGNGLELIPNMLEVGMERLLFLTAYVTEAIIYHTTKTYTKGLLWKGVTVSHLLVQALEDISDGRRYFSEEVRAAAGALRTKTDAFFKILSDRELELLPLLARGCTDLEVAEQSVLSPSTAKAHRQHIMKKLGLHSSEKLMRWAIEKGFSSQVTTSDTKLLALARYASQV